MGGGSFEHIIYYFSSTYFKFWDFRLKREHLGMCQKPCPTLAREREKVIISKILCQKKRARKVV